MYQYDICEVCDKKDTKACCDCFGADNFYNQELEDERDKEALEEFDRACE